GSTPKIWNKKMLNDTHLKILYYNANSVEIFPNTDIKGGIAISYRNENKEYGSIGTFSPYEEVHDILLKVKGSSFESFSKLIHAPESYKFSNKLHVDYPEVKSILSKGHEYAVMTNIFTKLPFIFTEEKEESLKDKYKFYGRYKNKRVSRWINKEYIENHPNLNSYKVLLPKSNGSGAMGERLSDTIISKPGEGHTQTYISIGSFETSYET